MVSLSLVFIFLNILLVVGIVFLNLPKSRIIATSLGIVDIALLFLKLFDSYVLNNQIEDFFINAVSSLNLTSSTSQYVTFFAGLIVLLQWLVLWITVYALLRRFIPYKPPILLTKHERRMLTNEAVLWKSVLFITANVMLIYTLRIVNYAANLDLGFLSFLFSLGFGVR